MRHATADAPPLAPDPLADPDPDRVADAATLDALLRCWTRELRVPVPTPGRVLVVPLPASGTTLEVAVRHRSATGWHRFAAPRLASRDADVATVAALVVREVVARQGLPHHRAADAVRRILDSRVQVADAVDQRRAHPDPDGGPAFLAAEQALLTGHPFHPSPKSREEAGALDVAALSPERRGRLPLHWFAVERELVAHDGADGWDAVATCAALLGDAIGLPPGTVAVPAHPWQAWRVRQRHDVAALLASGRIRHLGPAGPAWWPTSSLRTLHRPGAPVMLKLSLGLRITNSRREQLRSELALGVAAARLLDAGLADALAAAHPGFAILRDPAWLAIDVPAGTTTTSALEVAVREDPGDDRLVCTAGLLADRPDRDRSMVAGVLARLAATHGGDAAATWLERYLDRVIAPVLWLAGTWGIALEAHQQNTLVRLDSEGWPVGGAYRDSQGYYLARSRRDAPRRLLPGFGDDVEVVFDDDLVEDRLAYYVGVNHLLGLVGALGAQGLADEEHMVGVVRAWLVRLAGRLDLPLLDRLLDAPTLPAKANLLTCVDGRDELEGDVATQSLYVDLPNPLVEVHP